MLKYSNYKSFIEEYANEFHTYLDKEKVILSQTDEEYSQYLKEIETIKNNNPKITSIFDGDIIELSKNDCEDLQQIINLQYKISAKNEKAFFLKGCKEIIHYFEN